MIMHTKRKQKLLLIVAVLAALGAMVALILYAFSQNINLFYSPSDIAKGNAPADVTIRAGGMVKADSVLRSSDSLKVSFVITDFAHDIPVQFDGILPDLFREGQGIVAQGKLNQQGQFVASEVLAKHDENYMPPEVSDALKQAQNQPSQGNNK